MVEKPHLRHTSGGFFGDNHAGCRQEHPFDEYFPFGWDGGELALVALSPDEVAQIWAARGTRQWM
jgi:hypothetical protein